MKKQPALKILLFLIVGILLGRYFYVPASFLLSTITILFFAAFVSFFKKKEIICNSCLALSILISGLVLTSIFLNSSELGSIEKFIGKKVDITGIIVEEPKRYSNRIEYTVSLEEVENVKVSGLVKLKVYKDVLFSYYDRIGFQASLSRPKSGKGRGGFDYAFYLLSKKIRVIAKVKRTGNIGKIGREDPGILRTTCISLKYFLKDLFFNTIPAPESSILTGIVLGGHSEISKEVWQMFRDTGIVHILAVSGLHVGLVSAIFFFFFVNLLRMSRKLAVIVIIPFIWFYAAVTGGNPPVVRATLIITLLFLGNILERQTDIINSLALAALIILSFRPFALFSVSFQLSFIAVLSIISLYPRVDNLLQRGDRTNNRLLNYIRKLFAISVAVQIGIWPLTSFYFLRLSPISPFFNILAIPLLGVILSLGASMILFSKISVFITEILANANWVFLKILYLGVKTFSEIPYVTLSVKKLSLFFIFAYYLFLVLYLRKNEWNRKAIKFMVTSVCFVGLFFFLLK